MRVVTDTNKLFSAALSKMERLLKPFFQTNMSSLFPILLWLSFSNIKTN